MRLITAIALTGLLASCQSNSAQEPIRTIQEIKIGSFDFVEFKSKGFTTCTALNCGNRGSKQCQGDTGWFTIAKRSDENHTYVTYFPSPSENARNLQTTLTFNDRQISANKPFPNYPEAWIVPTRSKSDQMLSILRKGSNQQPTRIVTKTGPFSERIFMVGDITEIEAKLWANCPTQ